jgi:hypothetical protein
MVEGKKTTERTGVNGSLQKGKGKKGGQQKGHFTRREKEEGREGVPFLAPSSSRPEIGAAIELLAD